MGNSEHLSEVVAPQLPEPPTCPVNWSHEPCVFAKCAWWISDVADCAIPTVALSMHLISEDIYEEEQEEEAEQASFTDDCEFDEDEENARKLKEIDRIENEMIAAAEAAVKENLADDDEPVS